MVINIDKHAYLDPGPGDGERILVTRYWLRGFAKERVDTWIRELAPSESLLRGYIAFKKEEPNREALEKFHTEWSREFRKEMAAEKPLIQKLRKKHLAGETITLLCACHDPVFCHRSTLKELIEDESF